MNVKNKGIALALGTALISGASIFLNKFAVTGIDPFVFTALKNSLVALFILSLILGLKEKNNLKKLSKKQWFKLSLLGLIGGSIPFLLFFKGLALTSAAQASFWHKNMFLLIIPMSLIFLKEKLNKNYLLASLLLFLGNLLLLKRLSFNINMGDLYIILATLFWAVENTLSKHLLKGLASKTVGLGRMFFGSVFIWIFLLLTGKASLVLNLSLSQFAWTIFTSLFLGAYVLTWYAGLKRVKLSTAAVILLLGGPITSLLSLVFLQTIPSAKQSLAILFTILGIVLVVGIKEFVSLPQKILSLFYARS